MEAACQRLCQGDPSRLVDILNCMESRGSHEAIRLGPRTVCAIINVLLAEGAELQRAQSPDPLLPSHTAFCALRILAELGVRHTVDGLEVQRALLALGLSRCRDLCLDEYFNLARWQRFHVIVLVTMLMVLYGCMPHDLLRNPTSINLLTGAVEMPRVLAHRAGPMEPGTVRCALLQDPWRGTTASALAAVTGWGTIPNTASANAVAAAAAATTTTTTATTTTTTTASPPAADAANPARRGNIQNRSALLVFIPGTSFDMPLQPTRRFRELPKRAINTSFAVNPFYEPTPSHDSSRGTKHSSRSSSPVPAGGATPLAAAEVAIPAQFPTPVVLFSTYHGLGCVPRLPTMDDLVRLDAWRLRRGQHSPQRSSRKADAAAAAKPAAEGAATAISSGGILAWQEAVRAVLPDEESDTEPQLYQMHNDCVFAAASTVTLYHLRRCLVSPLLQQYTEQGRLLSWGAADKGALGPQRQRRTQTTSTAASTSAARITAVESQPPPSSSKASSATANGGATAAAASAKASSRARTNSPATAKQLKGSSPPPADARRTGEAASSAGPMASMLSLKAGTSASATASGDLTTTSHVFLPQTVHTTVRVAAVACGLSVSYVVALDGTLYSFGRAENGQLGVGERGVSYAKTGTSRLQRVVLRDKETVTRVASGSACAVAMANTRTFYCWGHNAYGQCLTMPDASRVLTPVRLRNQQDRVVEMCFGQCFGVLLYEDGLMGTWGISSMLGSARGSGELSPSLTADQCKCARQATLTDLDSNIRIAAVRAGPWHALAISREGEVFTWGVGRGGRLGHGTDAAEVTPRVVEALQACFAVDASCASAHTAVLTNTGTVYVFGENTDGQLGLRRRMPRRSPVLLPLPCRAVAVTCAREHTCILLEDGDVAACGSYRSSGIGLGYGTCLSAPVRILTNYVSLTLRCGHFHTLAAAVPRRTSLMLVGRSTMEEISRVSSLVVRNGVRCAASGVGFLVVLSENNSLVAIGRGERGQLGIGECMKPTHADDVTVTPQFMNVQMPTNVVVQHFRCGPDFVVALDEHGDVYGWGSNEHCKLCQPASVGHVYTPVRLGGYGRVRTVQVACGGSFVISLTAEGEVLAHGEAAYCGLGDASGTTPSTTSEPSAAACIQTPTPITKLRDVVAIAAGRRHAIAMTASCSIYAWGLGVLGTGAHVATTSSIATSPVRVALSQSIRTIGCGPHNSFAITAEGELWVWGVNRFGECGVPPTTEDTTAVLATPTSVAREVRDAAFTGRFGLAIFEDGQVRVSGRVHHGRQLYVLPGFHSEPQPPFSVDVNEPSRESRSQRGKDGASTTAASAPPRMQDRTATPAAATTAGTSSAAPPSSAVAPQASSAHGNDAVEEIGDEENEANEEPFAGGEHDLVYSLTPPADASLSRTPATAAATTATAPATTATAPATATATTATKSSTVSQRSPIQLPESEAPLPGRRLSSTSGEGGRGSRLELRRRQPSAAPSPLKAPAPSAMTTRVTIQPPARRRSPSVPGAGGSSSSTARLPSALASSPVLPPVRAQSAQCRVPELCTSGSSALGGAVSLPPELSLPPASFTGVASQEPSPRLQSTRERRLSTDDATGAAETASAVTLEEDGYEAGEMAGAAAAAAAAVTRHDGTAPPSTSVSQPHKRTFPEVDNGSSSPLQAPLTGSPPGATEERGGNAKSTDDAPPTGALAANKPAFPHPPRKVPRPTASSPRGPLSVPARNSNSRDTAAAPTAQTDTAAAVSPSDGAAVQDGDVSNGNAADTTVPSPPAERHIFGTRCFPGWELICTVVEKHRPAVDEVRRAQVGLQASLHRSLSDPEAQV